MKTNGKLVFEKTDNSHKVSTTTIFTGLLYLVSFKEDMGLLTTIIVYFMVELETIPRYDFLTFLSQTIYNHK